jgi:hypothetical protein
LQNPARYFLLDPNNFLNSPRVPFVEERKAAQLLAADAVGALHSQRLDQAQEDLHALARLAQLHRDDMTLVSQMIRVAITGLGLSATWEALQIKGWTDEDLTALQKDWEEVDLFNALEKGMLGSRAHGENVIAWTRDASVQQRIQTLGMSAGPPWTKDDLSNWGFMFLWRMSSQSDELLMLQTFQKNLDSIRRLQRGTPWKQVQAEIKLCADGLQAKENSPLLRIRYYFSLIMMNPNYSKAAASVVRNETQRRLTVTAIALERYRLRQGRFPADLGALVPRYLSAVPMDPMSGKPLCYRLNADGTFTLYSVGEDGVDDGGDPNPSSVTNQFGLWSGKDAVWPAADIGGR